MKIKGIKTGTLRGEIIEYSPTEKIEPVVKELVPSLAPAGEVWWAENVNPIELDIIHGKPLTRGYAGNTYIATVSFHVRPMRNDRLYRGIPKKMKITFKDILDKNGLPDLEVVKYEDIQ